MASLRDLTAYMLHLGLFFPPGIRRFGERDWEVYLAALQDATSGLEPRFTWVDSVANPLIFLAVPVGACITGEVIMHFYFPASDWLELGRQNEVGATKGSRKELFLISPHNTTLHTRKKRFV